MIIPILSDMIEIKCPLLTSRESLHRPQVLCICSATCYAQRPTAEISSAREVNTGEDGCFGY